MAYDLSPQFKSLPQQKGFTNIPDVSLPSADYRVFTLYCWFNQKQQRNPSAEELAAKLRMSKQQIYAIQKRMVASGVLVKLADAAISAGYKKCPIPADLRWKIFKRDGYTCQQCGSDSDLTVDHIHPERRGGSLDPANLRTLCRSCNSSKGARI